LTFLSNFVNFDSSVFCQKLTGGSYLESIRENKKKYGFSKWPWSWPQLRVWLLKSSRQKVRYQTTNYFTKTCLCIDVGRINRQKKLNDKDPKPSGRGKSRPFLLANKKRAGQALKYNFFKIRDSTSISQHTRYSDSRFDRYCHKPDSKPGLQALLCPEQGEALRNLNNACDLQETNCRMHIPETDL